MDGKVGMKKIVLQTIDSPRRDLEWRVFVALKLSREGISSVIGSVGQINSLLEKSENCIYLGRFGGASGRTGFDKRTIELMQENNTSMFFLHDEGAFYLNGEYERLVKLIYPEVYFSLPVLEKVFFWGEKQKVIYKNHPEASKFLVTGAPRFDLCRADYADLDSTTIKDLVNKYKDFVLVSGRFAAVNTVPDDPSFLGKRIYEIYLEGGALESSKKEDILTGMFKYWEKCSIEFGRFVSSVARLAMEYPELNFVFRPHPAERSSFYKEAFSHFNNVFVDKSFDARPFIRASKVVIHSECTTGIEAEISQKPNINYRPCLNLTEFEEIDVAGASEVGIIVENYEELRNSLQELLDSDFKFTKSNFDASDYLLNAADDISSSEIIINEIKKFCEENISESNIKVIARPSIGRLLRSSKLFLKKIWVFLFFRKCIESGDSKMIFYPNKKIKKLWVNLGGDPKCLKIKNGIIYTYPDVP